MVKITSDNRVTMSIVMSALAGSNLIGVKETARKRWFLVGLGGTNVIEINDVLNVINHPRTTNNHP